MKVFYYRVLEADKRDGLVKTCIRILLVSKLSSAQTQKTKTKLKTTGVELQKLRFFRSFFEIGALGHFIRSEQWLLTTGPSCPFYVKFITEHCYINLLMAVCVPYHNNNNN